MMHGSRLTITPRNGRISGSDLMKPFQDRWMLVARALGMPIVLDGSEEVRFKESGRFFKCLVIPLTFAALLIGSVFASFFVWDLDVDTFLNERFRHALSSWDLYSTFIFAVPGTFGPFLYFVSYKGLGDKMTKYCELYLEVAANASSKMIRTESDVLQSTKRKVWLSQLLWTGLAVMMTTGNYLYIEELVPFRDGLITVALATIGFMGMTCSPVELATIAALSYVLGCLRERLHQYRKDLELPFIVPKPRTVPRAFYTQGCRLLALTDVVNDAFGLLLISLFLVSIVKSACGLYLATSIVNVYTGREFRLIPLLYGSSVGLAGFYSLTVLKMLHQAGYNLELEYSLIKKRLQMLAIDNANGSTERERAEVEYLIGEFSASSPLRPMKACNVNFSAAASLTALIITYIIVLLQFKVGDESTSHCVCSRNETDVE